MDNKRVASPEWVTTVRGDRKINDSLQGGWGVSPAPAVRGSSFTDFSTCEMAVPVGDTPAEKAIRLHELLHAGLSPTEVPLELLSQIGITPQAVRLAEEVRINLIGRYVASARPTRISGDILDLEDGSETSICNEIIKRKSWNEAVSMLVTTLNTAAYKKVKRKLRTVHEWRDAISEVERRLNMCGYNFDARKSGDRSMSRYMVDNYAKDTTPVVYKWQSEKNGERHTVFTEGFRDVTIPLALLIDRFFEGDPGKVREEAEGFSMVSEKAKKEMMFGNSKWEELIMGSVRLSEQTASFLSKRKRPAMTGKYPSRPDRLLTDPERRIFREAVRSRGGVVVFDCSGSMGVTHETVRDAVKQFAGATVVVYSHNRMGGANAWVVARNGRMVNESDFSELPLHSGNGVDGPILRWALKQRRSPKDFILWVSDGQVTGRRDGFYNGLLAECALLSLRHNIIGVDNCEEAIQLLAEMKRTGAVPRNKFCRIVTNHLKTGMTK